MIKTPFLISLLLASACTYANTSQGKLVATSGLLQIEGSGGGGLVPWATLAGYDTKEEISVSAGISQVSLKDYRLNSVALAASLYDRVELSLAKHTFDLSSLGGEIRQRIVGLKYKISGDAVYSTWPQVSLGLQYKSLDDTAIAKALGAESTSGTDIYLAATKVHLGAVFGYNAVWNLTARATKANELGLLGFGGALQNDYEIMAEASFGILFSRHFAVGVEYRQKPNNLGLQESDWLDAFITYIPSKSISFTLAWTQLGTIAGAPNQEGAYLSISGRLY